MVSWQSKPDPDSIDLTRIRNSGAWLTLTERDLVVFYELLDPETVGAPGVPVEGEAVGHHPADASSESQAQQLLVYK